MKKKVKALSAAQKAKALGLPSLDYVVNKANKSRATLHRWHLENPALFDIVLKGCLADYNAKNA